MPSDDFYPTLLGLDGIDFPDWAVRGLTVEISLVPNGELAYDAQGNLVNLTVVQLRKRRVAITCTDMDAPVLRDVWPGDEVEVTLIEGLGMDDSAGPLVLECMVENYAAGREEYAASTNWSLSLLQK